MFGNLVVTVYVLCGTKNCTSNFYTLTKNAGQCNKKEGHKALNVSQCFPAPNFDDVVRDKIIISYSLNRAAV